MGQIPQRKKRAALSIPGNGLFTQVGIAAGYGLLFLGRSSHYGMEHQSDARRNGSQGVGRLSGENPEKTRFLPGEINFLRGYFDLWHVRNLGAFQAPW